MHVNGKQIVAAKSKKSKSVHDHDNLFTISPARKSFIQSAAEILSAWKNVNKLKVVTLVRVALETFYNTCVVQES